MSETTMPQREVSNAELVQLIGMMARRIDQQAANFAAVAGVVAALSVTKHCEPTLAMSAAGLMIPKRPENEELRRSAAANALAIVAAARTLDSVVKGLDAQAKAASAAQGAQPADGTDAEAIPAQA